MTRRRPSPVGVLFVGLLVVAIVLLAVGRVVVGGVLLALVLLVFAGVGVSGNVPGRRGPADSRVQELLRGQIGRGPRFDPSEPAAYDEQAWARVRAERKAADPSEAPERGSGSS